MYARGELSRRAQLTFDVEGYELSRRRRVSLYHTAGRVPQSTITALSVCVVQTSLRRVTGQRTCFVFKFAYRDPHIRIWRGSVLDFPPQLPDANRHANRTSHLKCAPSPPRGPRLE